MGIWIIGGIVLTVVVTAIHMAIRYRFKNKK